MKTIKTVLLATLLSIQGLAHAYVLPSQLSPTILNQVSFDMIGEQWVSTKTARVIVAVNAGIGEDKLSTAYVEMTKKLQKLIGNSEWHITDFERSTDKSGLEQLYVTAETRLPESELATLKSRLKAASKAGETYTVANVDYTPSLIEREAAQTALRNQIYNQIKTDIAQLNAAYPNQKYSVHNIEFIENTPAPTPMLMGAMVRQATPTTNNTTMPVSNNLQLRAHVVLATEPVVTANK